VESDHLLNRGCGSERECPEVVVAEETLRYRQDYDPVVIHCSRWIFAHEVGSVSSEKQITSRLAEYERGHKRITKVGANLSSACSV
jgi:hypothetical protein